MFCSNNIILLKEQMQINLLTQDVHYLGSLVSFLPSLLYLPPFLVFVRQVLYGLNPFVFNFLTY
jgi:hypothetical protein